MLPRALLPAYRTPVIIMQRYRHDPWPAQPLRPPILLIFPHAPCHPTPKNPCLFSMDLLICALRSHTMHMKRQVTGKAISITCRRSSTTIISAVTAIGARGTCHRAIWRTVQPVLLRPSPTIPALAMSQIMRVISGAMLNSKVIRCRGREVRLSSEVMIGERDVFEGVLPSHWSSAHPQLRIPSAAQMRHMLPPPLSHILR